MTQNVAVGTFDAATSTGNHTPVSSLSFQPNCLILFASKQTAAGDAVDFSMSVGFSVGAGAGDEIAMSWSGEDADSGGGDVAFWQVEDRALDIVDFATTSLYREELVSFNSNGFTLNNVIAAAAAWKIGYMAIECTNAGVLEIDSSSTVTTKDYTSFGFDPNCIIVLGGLVSTRADTDDSWGGIGFATAAAEQCCVGWFSDDATTSVADRIFRSDLVYAPMQPSGATLLEAAFDSWLTGGFRLDWQKVSGTRNIPVLALELDNAMVVTDTAATSVTTKNTSTTGIDPNAIIGISAGTTDENATPDREIALWTTDGTGYFGRWAGDEDGVTTSVADSSLSISAVDLFQINTAGTPATRSEADFDSFGSEQFTLDWTVSDGSAYKFGALVFGSAAAGGGSTPKGPLVNGGMVNSGMVNRSLIA